MTDHRRAIKQQDMDGVIPVVRIDIEPVGTPEDLPALLLNKYPMAESETGTQQFPAPRPVGWPDDADAEICRQRGLVKH